MKYENTQDLVLRYKGCFINPEQVFYNGAMARATGDSDKTIDDLGFRGVNIIFVNIPYMQGDGSY